MKFTARIFSLLFSPLLMPTYAMAIALWGTYLRALALKTQLTVMIFTFTVTSMIPIIIIFALYRFGLLKDPGLNIRSERPIPYVASLVCYMFVALFLIMSKAPHWLYMFIFGAAAVIVVNLIVNFFWKISGHAAGMGGLVAMTFFLCIRSYTYYNNDYLFIAAVAIAGIVCTSRLILQRHTLAQVYAGFANGAICVTLSQLI